MFLKTIKVPKWLIFPGPVTFYTVTGLISVSSRSSDLPYDSIRVTNFDSSNSQLEEIKVIQMLLIFVLLKILVI